MNIISITIQKGGSGKTTTTINLGAALQRLGKEVLLIDLDPQANLTQALGIRSEANPSIYHLLGQAKNRETLVFDEAIKHAGELSFIPASLELANAELELVSAINREKIMKRILEAIPEKYDYLLIDCPPSIGMLTVNALTASDYVLMPLQAEFLPLKGIQSFMRTFDLIKEINTDLSILGVLLTQYDKRKSMNRSILGELMEQFGNKVFETRIRRNIALAQAQEWGTDIFNYDKTSRGAYDYLQLAEEVIERIEPAS